MKALSMSNAKANILKRLQENAITPLAELDSTASQYQWDKPTKIKRLTDQMSAVRTEVVHLEHESWLDWLNRELPERKLNSILTGSHTLFDDFRKAAHPSLLVKQYDQAIEHWKQALFQDIDVGITTCKGAIAETGSLILWPDENEPRLLSLVPPVHIALLQSEKIFETFNQAITKLDWANQTPTNALLISGPSKTSDIEQTLAFGIHGPQKLIVLII